MEMNRHDEVRKFRRVLAVAMLIAIGIPGALAKAEDTTTKNDDTGFLAYPVPISSLWEKPKKSSSASDGDNRESRDAYDRTPVLPPIPPGGPAASPEWPSTDEVLRSLHEIDDSTRAASVVDLHRRMQHVTTQKVADWIDPPRIYPLIGPAQVHHVRYKCTVCLQSAPIKGADAAAIAGRFETHIIWLDHTHIHMIDDSKIVAGNARDTAK